MEKRGCVHIYTGDGKGKTTAAVGLCARAVGQGLRAGFCQFLKTGASGEVRALERLGVWVMSPPDEAKFLWQMDEAERAACAGRQRETLEAATERAGELDLLVLDEAVCLVQAGLIKEEALMNTIREKPAGLELVLTGRGASPKLLALADYATEMRSLAHPFDGGRKARKGIEF